MPLSTPFPTLELSDPAFERDHLRAVTVKSPALGHRADVSVFVPPNSSGDAPMQHLLVLLHGVRGSHWVWPLKSGVHLIAQQLIAAREIPPLVIAMPSDGLSRDGSGYLSHPDPSGSSAEDVERWILDEVPAIARIAAPTLATEAAVSIAGLSMGGYGALRLGAKYPDRFTAISAHSAITRIEEFGEFVSEPFSDYLRCGTPQDLSPLHWLRLHRDRLPRLRFDCGLADDLLAGNRRLHHELDLAAISHTYREYPGGHEWSYWQQHVAETLRFTTRADHTP